LKDDAALLEESMGKILIAFAVAGSVIGAFADFAAAAPVLGRPDATVSSNVVEAAVRCGPRAHYVPAHRDRHGRRILGRCVRNRR
jgi:hypothetical protein